jgi:hypothetical protein
MIETATTAAAVNTTVKNVTSLSVVADLPTARLAVISSASAACNSVVDMIRESSKQRRKYRLSS